MKVHRLYVESDNLEPAKDLLAKLPDGQTHIMVGAYSNNSDILQALIPSSRKEAKLIIDKIQSGELISKAMADKVPVDKDIVVSVDE
jgi:hypothetical protein